jgi:uncharacterized protein YndB with AHSA1/START domain
MRRTRAERGMSEAGSIEAIRRTVRVHASVERAFGQFVELQSWWPREYTWSQDTLERIGIEPGSGGHCYEAGPHGFHCDWGTVTVWDPPRRLVFLWQISPERTPEPNPARASEVELRFVAEGAQETRLELEHRAFERHGAGGQRYRDGLAAAEGWTRMLDRFASSVR